MRIGEKELIVVGDRVLIEVEEGEERTTGGILVPATAVTQRQVSTGRVVAVGPGTPVPQPTDVSDEPWKDAAPSSTYVPIQAQVGDVAVFLRSAAVELTVEGRRYLIVPNGAVLVLERTHDPMLD